MPRETSQPSDSADHSKEPVGPDQTFHDRGLGPAIRLVIRLGGLAVALLLIVVGLAKAFEPGPLVEAIRAHGLVPGSWVWTTATAVIALEIGVGAAALAHIACTPRARLGMMLLAGLGLALTLYAGGLWVMPPDEPAACGCGLIADTGPANWAVITMRNAIATAFLFVGSLVLPARLKTRALRIGHTRRVIALG